MKQDVGAIAIWDGTSIPDSRHIALGLHEAGHNVTLHTSFYHRASSSFSGHLGRLPGRFGERARSVLDRRRQPQFEHLNIRSWFFPDAIAQSARLARVPPGAAYLLANWTLDALASRRISPSLGLILIRQGSGVRTLARAREVGVRSVLLTSTPHPLDEWEFVDNEERILGLQRATIAPTNLRLWQRIQREYVLADFILCSSDFAAGTIAQRSGRPLSSIKVVPMTSDVEPASLKRNSLNGRDGGRGGPFRVLFVGSITPRKGLHYLVPAVCELAAEGIGIVLDLVGPAPDRDYMRLLAKSTLDGIVRFRGPVSHQNLTREYLAADAFVLPSLSDSFGMVVAEAKACGLPVIITDRCGAAVRHGREGFVVPAGDARALKEALRTLIGQPQLRRRMSGEALRTIQAYSWSDYRQEVVSWLEETVL